MVIEGLSIAAVAVGLGRIAWVHWCKTEPPVVITPKPVKVPPEMASASH